MKAFPLFPSTLDIQPIKLLLDPIIEYWNPEQIWLFGSRAKGTHTNQSDWDLLVVTPNESGEDELSMERRAWDLRRKAQINADILFCSAHDFESYASVPNTLIFEVAKTGVVIYESRRANSQASDDSEFLTAS